MPAPAYAAVPPLPGPVQDVVDTVEDIANSDDPIEEVIDAVDDVAGDVTGTDDPIEDAIDDVEDAVNETVDDAEEIVDDVIDDAGGTVDDVVEAVDEATGGTVGDVIGGGQGGNDPGPGGGSPGSGGARTPGGRSLTPDGALVPRARRASQAERGPRSSSGAGAGAPVTDGTTGAATETSSPLTDEPGLGERLRQAAIDASKKLAVPLTLTLVVLGYLIAQYWADRRDPKLVLAPVDADHDLLSFS